MRIGYFGGSFDPPHRGHLAVARAARDRFALDRVLLAPTGSQPLKPNGPEAPWADRLRLCELLCAGESRLEASAIDAPQPNGQPNYTVDTLRHLRHQLSPELLETEHPPNSELELELNSELKTERTPDPRPETEQITNSYPQPTAPRQLFAILGADAFATLPHWREPAELFRLAEWIIVSRPGSDLPSLTDPGLPAFARSRLHPLDGIVDPVSATALRARLRRGLDCESLIPAPVLSYLRARHLYGT